MILSLCQLSCFDHCFTITSIAAPTIVAATKMSYAADAFYSYFAFDY